MSLLSLPWTIRLMLVSSDPNAFVATQVKSAVSVRSARLTLRSLRTPFDKMSSLMVYPGSDFGSSLFPSRLHRIPIGFSPLASHWRTADSPLRAVRLRNLISNWGGAETELNWFVLDSGYPVFFRFLFVYLGQKRRWPPKGLLLFHCLPHRGSTLLSSSELKEWSSDRLRLAFQEQSPSNRDSPLAHHLTG